MENVNKLERGLSIALGAGLVALGMRRRMSTRVGLAAAAGALIGRGLTGRSKIYSALHVTSA